MQLYTCRGFHIAAVSYTHVSANSRLTGGHKMFNDLVTGHYLTIPSKINRLQRVAQKLRNMFIEIH
jgi:hypothetical protein